MPPPEGPIRRPSPAGRDVSIRLIPIELKYTNDLNTLEKHTEARAIYSGPDKLTGALPAADWTVEHDFPIGVIGHRAVVAAKSKEGYNMIGITSKKD